MNTLKLMLVSIIVGASSLMAEIYVGGSYSYLTSPLAQNPSLHKSAKQGFTARLGLADKKGGFGLEAEHGMLVLPIVLSDNTSVSGNYINSYISYALTIPFVEDLLLKV